MGAARRYKDWRDVFAARAIGIFEIGEPKAVLISARHRSIRGQMSRSPSREFELLKSNLGVGNPFGGFPTSPAVVLPVWSPA